jgi:hypothetical protein
MFGNDIRPLPPTDLLPHAQCPRCKRVYIARTMSEARASGMNEAAIARARTCHTGCGGPASVFRVLAREEAERAVPAGCTISIVVIDRTDEVA